MRSRLCMFQSAATHRHCESLPPDVFYAGTKQSHHTRILSRHVFRAAPASAAYPVELTGSLRQYCKQSYILDTVVLMGVATEFVVEAAARHAADADYRVIVLEDCCAAFSDEAHRASLHVMDHLATLATSADFIGSV
ncbi:MAG: isochorismatase family protein [Deltaproteobacteria bacterium]|nr:isochorismatase family protein [Deltaproteobacteria bacterium]